MKDLLPLMYPAALINEGFCAIQTAQRNKGFCHWAPGKKPGFPGDPEEVDLFGFGYRVFPTYEESRHGQNFVVSWAGIDIDDVEPMETAHKIKDARMPCSIRTSKSQKGLHLIFLFNKILGFYQGQSPRRSILHALEPALRTLDELDIPVCKIAPEIMWEQGKQHFGETLTVCEARIPTQKVRTVPILERPISLNCSFPGEVQDFVRLLAAAGALLGGFCEGTAGIYVRAAYEACKGTRFEFETKSPMKSERSHNNGFLSWDGVKMALIPSADGHPRLYVSDLLIEKVPLADKPGDNCKN